MPSLSFAICVGVGRSEGPSRSFKVPCAKRVICRSVKGCWGPHPPKGLCLPKSLVSKNGGFSEQNPKWSWGGVVLPLSALPFLGPGL